MGKTHCGMGRPKPLARKALSPTLQGDRRGLAQLHPAFCNMYLLFLQNNARAGKIMLALQTSWADSHSVLGWGPGELPTTPLGPEGRLDPGSRGRKGSVVSHPTQLLNHPLRMCLGALPAGPPTPGRLPYPGHLPTACQAAPPCCPPREPLLRGPSCQLPLDAGVNLERLCVVKILKQLLTVVE